MERCGLAGRFTIERGSLVARTRPTASNDTSPMLACVDGALTISDGPLLTRAEAHALRRSAPLTHTQLKAHLQALPAPPLRAL
jgi:hypothetical protein